MGGLFLHPLLAILGTALVAVPIVIHLLNRRRFQVVRWGAMSFLLAALKKTRRRLELENLLLLLLRALAVLLLGLAIARPSLSPDSPLAIVVGDRRDVVVVLDASWSMGYRDGALTSFDKGIAAARTILETLRPERQDRATLILGKRRPMRLSEMSISSARDQLSLLQGPSFEDMDLAATLELVAQEVDAFGPEVETGAEKANDAGAIAYLVTDLQRSTFFPREEERLAAPAAPGAAATEAPVGLSPLRSASAALVARKVALRVVDVGPPTEGPVENTGVVHLETAHEHPATGVPVEIRAEVRNFGISPRAKLVVTPTVDGNREAPQTIDLGPGERRQVTIPLVFRESGDHAVEVAIEEDALPADDRRTFALHVRPPLRVLVVDGAPDPDPEIASAGMIGLALTAADDPLAVSPFQLVSGQPIDRARFASQIDLLEQADVLVLVNCEGFSAEQSVSIRDWVEGGGGLMAFLGDKVDPSAYNLRLRMGDDPLRWLLPGTIGDIAEVPSREHRPWRVAHLADPVPEYLRFFEPEERRPLLTEVPVFRFLSVDVSDEDLRGGAQVLARFDDPALSPFLVAKLLGRGRVAVVTTSVDLSPDRRWSRIAESVKTFIPFLFDVLHAVASPDTDSQNLEVGRLLRTEVRGFPRRAVVTDPLGRAHDVAATARPVGRDDAPATGAAPIAPPPTGSAADRYVVSHSATDRPGLYTLEVDATGAVGMTAATAMRFAVGLQSEEGDLSRAATASLTTALPGVDVKIATGTESESLPVSEGPRSEIWRVLAACALAVLVLESALATWFGRRRS